MEINYIIIGMIVILNLLGYMSMWSDKKRAIKGEYRISEKALFTIALLGGSLGSMLGMKQFRHKTKHWYFRYGIPLILIIQLVIICVVIKFI